MDPSSAETLAQGIQGLVTTIPAHVDVFSNSGANASVYGFCLGQQSLPLRPLFSLHSIIDGRSLL